MNQEKEDASRITKRHSWVIVLVSCLIAVVFSVVTIVGAGSLNQNLDTLSEHPFAVSGSLYKIRRYMSDSQIRMGRLLQYNDTADVEIVKNALMEIYGQIDENAAYVVENYLGKDLGNDDELVELIGQIREQENILLDHSAAWTAEQNEEFTAQHLTPLYEQLDELTNQMIQYTENTVVELSRKSDGILTTTILFTCILCAAIVIVSILYRHSVNKELRAQAAYYNDIHYREFLFNILSGNIDDVYLIYNFTGKNMDFVSTNMERIFGVDCDKVNGDMETLFAYCDFGEQNDEVKTALERETLIHAEWEGTLKNPRSGKTTDIRFGIYPAMEQNGVVRYIVEISDLTKIKKTQQTLMDALANAQQANEAKSEFLSRMSHEIRTPMNAIIGMSTIAAAKIDDRVRVEDCLAKIGYASKHLLMLINDILDMSKIESNKLTLTNEPFDIYQFLNTFMSIVYQQACEKGVELTEKITGFDDHSSTLAGDSLRLNQVLLNLTSNAIKFTQKGGHISISVQRFLRQGKNQRVRFIVEDTGVGMDADTLERIFDPFEQANAGIAKKYGGSGLGLSITKNLVTLMGGTIDIESAPGKGTVCTVELPFEMSDVELSYVKEEELKSLHVLVVDDEKDVCEHTAILLERMSINASWVLSGREAVEAVERAYRQEKMFDVCFIDWKMPEMNGLETTRRIRRTVGGDIPIIIISAYDWTDIEQEARAAGANGFISKPLFGSSLYNTLVSVTGGSFGHSGTIGQPEDYTLEGKTFLAVEDNEVNMEILKEMLELNNAQEVVCAYDGTEAVERFRESEPGTFDAILMDIQMPEMDGYEAARIIRALDRPDAAGIPIIATTANAFSEDVSAVLAAGMDAHTSKPINMHELCKLLRKLTIKHPGD